jgi:hypothetical protein
VQAAPTFGVRTALFDERGDMSGRLGPRLDLPVVSPEDGRLRFLRFAPA